MDITRNLGINLTLMSPTDLQEGVARLSRGAYFKEASLDVTLSILTESAAQMSGIGRVSIWALSDSQAELRCLDLYELAGARHRKGMSLHARDFPVYFRALRSEECIVADDAALHPATREFVGNYFTEHGITALLDTPIHIRGGLEGVLCLEQVGTHLPWTATHRLFAHAVANLVSMALVEYEAAEARQQNEATQENLRQMLKKMPVSAVDRNIQLV
jgi:GAF domain-containing protein